MAEPARVDLRARRNTPFTAVWSFTEDGEPFDFTGAVVTMQVRLRGAQPGDALIDLVEVATAETEGLLVAEGQITCWIDEAPLRLLPTGKAGADVAFTYDLLVTAPGRVEEAWAGGTFTVTPGVTDRLNFLIAGAGNYLTAGGSYLIAR